MDRQPERTSEYSPAGHPERRTGRAGRKSKSLAPEPIARKLQATITLVLLLLAALAGAHPANIASARAKVGMDGSFELKVRFDLLAYCLDLPPSEIQDGPMNALLDGPISDLQASLTAARSKFQQRVQIQSDAGSVSDASLTFPLARDVEAFVAQTPQQRLPVMLAATITGRLPKGAKSVSFKFPDALGTVVLTTEFPYQEPQSQPVEAGSTSAPAQMPDPKAVAAMEASIQAHAAASQPAVHRRDADATAKAAPFAGAKGSAQADAPLLKKGSDTAPGLIPTPSADKAPLPTPNGQRSTPREASAPTPSIQTGQAVPPIPQDLSTPRPSPRAWYANFLAFIKMGFQHIVPNGLDHILFVLGLFLLSNRTKDLLKQVTAFTVAHSLTLALSLYGVVRLSSSVVEPIIALSIVFVAVENLCTTKMHKWRIGIVFLFGLVHGLGFASALQDTGIARADFLTALVGFNSGVELGQLSVVAAAFLLVGWFRSSARYRPLVAMPASLLIAVTAAVWTVERLL